MADDDFGDDPKSLVFLVDRFYGRKPVDAELIAMDAEMQRDAMWIASHPYGLDGGMFLAEPSGFTVWLRKEASS